MTAASREEPVPVRKAILRVQMQDRLESITADQAREWSERLWRQVLALPEVAGAEGILTCLSFGREPDTWGLVDRLLALDRRVYVPRVEAGDGQLHVHAYPCELCTLSFGLRQPLPGTPEVAPESIDRGIDVVLVLGLAFDRHGYRLGHGGGYFDRFLEGHSLPTVGLAYELQVQDEVPREPHDVPMSLIVTELGPASN